MIYKRYLASEILRSGAGVFCLVVIIFACDCAVKYLSESVAGSLPPAMVGYLIFLRVTIGLEGRGHGQHSENNNFFITSGGCSVGRHISFRSSYGMDRDLSRDG